MIVLEVNYNDMLLRFPEVLYGVAPRHCFHYSFANRLCNKKSKESIKYLLFSDKLLIGVAFFLKFFTNAVVSIIRAGNCPSLEDK